MFKISKRYELIPKTIRIQENIVKKLENISRENNISFNSLVIQCIEYALQNMDNESENKNDKKELNS